MLPTSIGTPSEGAREERRAAPLPTVGGGLDEWRVVVVGWDWPVVRHGTHLPIVGVGSAQTLRVDSLDYKKTDMPVCGVFMCLRMLY